MMNAKQIITLTVVLIFPVIYTAQTEQNNQNAKQNQIKPTIAKAFVGLGALIFGSGSSLAALNAIRLFRASKKFNLQELTNTVSNASTILEKALFKENKEVQDYVNNVGSSLFESWCPIGKMLEAEKEVVQQEVKKSGIIKILFTPLNIDTNTTGTNIESFIKKISTSDINDGQNSLVAFIKQNLAIRGTITLGIAGICAFCASFLALALVAKNEQKKKTAEAEVAQ